MIGYHHLVLFLSGLETLERPKRSGDLLLHGGADPQLCGSGPHLPQLVRDCVRGSRGADPLVHSPAAGKTQDECLRH